MKIFDFLSMYDFCPICGDVLHYLMHYVSQCTDIYTINKITKNEFSFTRIDEIFVGTNISHFPESFHIIDDRIILSEKQSFDFSGEIFLSAGCNFKNDFLMYSTNFKFTDDTKIRKE